MLYAIFAVLGAALLALDQWVKHWITMNLPLGESAPLLPGLVELRTVHNYGAAWSSFSGQRWLLLAVTGCIVWRCCTPWCAASSAIPWGWPPAS